MTSLRHRLGSTACVAATALTLTCTAISTATTASAADVPQSVDIDRGATAEVPFTYQNTGGNHTISPTGGSVVFTAPEHTTFAAQTTVPSLYSANGQSWGFTNVGLRNCRRSNEDRTLTCDAYSKNGGDSSWNINTYRQFRPKVTVADDAPFGKLPTGTGTFNFRNPQGTRYSPKGTLNVNVPVPVMCLVAPKDAGLHDPVRIWKCDDLDNTPYASDWQYAGNHLESTDSTSTDNIKCAYNWPTQAGQVQMWNCGVGDSRVDWTRQGLQFVHNDTGLCMDAGDDRRNGDIVMLQSCTAGNTNQDWTWSGSKLVVR
ncbi:ricin-type beta-trefoil lectin domain protein [Streptomyces sp. NPDC059524]|uniref:ricin-type beta-trefoil lectin domain protein n=1 Tax=Streptomyces sp. NPDC059524 TaxID=3346856 RepID=UPI0036944794